MRKLIKVTAVTLALILAPACIIVPVEDKGKIVHTFPDDYYYEADYCEDLPYDSELVACEDVVDRSTRPFSTYLGTCCEVYFPYGSRCLAGGESFSHFQTWCQWHDGCGWEPDGSVYCYSEYDEVY